MFRFLIPLMLWTASALPLAAADPERINDLAVALGLPEIIEVMREEGIDYGAELAKDMFPGRGGAEWRAVVDRIYDQDWMAETVWNGIAEGLSSTDLGPLMIYFTSPQGAQIISLEISARRALMDEAVEEASKEHLATLIAADDPRLDLIELYVVANDLLENNVVGSLNSNFAFYTGLAQSGTFDQNLTEDQILTDVWSQEADIRADTEEWLYSFLVMAYQPLEDADLEAYIAVSETPEGQDLNQAMFTAFDGMFEEVSRALGLAAAAFIVGEDL